MVAIFFVSLLSGCAAGPRDGSLQQQLDTTQQDLADAQAEIAELRQQVAELQDQAGKQQATLAVMRTSIAQIRGRLAGKGASDTLLPADSRTRRDMEKKLDQIEASLNESSAAAPAGEDEKNAYSAAYLALKSGRYDEASQDFSALVRKYPKGEYIDQALYWYGESLYAQHRLKRAAQVLEQVVRQHPKSVKRAAALLRLGSVYKDLHRTGDAAAVFKRLIREYPHTVMAANARLALQQIEQENKK